jgi:hypothetical protein
MTSNWQATKRTVTSDAAQSSAGATNRAALMRPLGVGPLQQGLAGVKLLAHAQDRRELQVLHPLSAQPCVHGHAIETQDGVIQQEQHAGTGRPSGDI